MKKLLPAIAAFILVSLSSFAQSLQITADTTSFSGPANIVMTGTCRVTNVGANAIFVKVKRTVVDTASGHVTNFCWNGACYPATTSESPTYVIMNPGDVDTTLLADLNPRGFGGTSTVTYSFYDMDNVSDESLITFTYRASSVGIDEVGALKYISNMYPNPADAVTHVSYAINSGKEARLVISNLLGSVVKEIAIADKQGVSTIPTSDMKTGIYICSIIIDGKSYGSKKLIVSHR
ncbi:MAG TPA: T9SS type A sorting domain-containing protein [Bacteroidia bacterium]|nr:T9SS type A sorting domain-containing protein [Bacteroidia bacterium]HNP99290.1 T9SS type A sorting domain-containing protein [Bacteroidia bacterium]